MLAAHCNTKLLVINKPTYNLIFLFICCKRSSCLCVKKPLNLMGLLQPFLKFVENILKLTDFLKSLGSVTGHLSHFLFCSSPIARMHLWSPFWLQSNFSLWSSLNKDYWFFALISFIFQANKGPNRTFALLGYVEKNAHFSPYLYCNVIH